MRARIHVRFGTALVGVTMLAVGACSNHEK